MRVGDGAFGRDTYPYVHDATVDVAKFLEAKEPRSVGGVIECVALIRKELFSFRLLVISLSWWFLTVVAKMGTARELVVGSGSWL